MSVNTAHANKGVLIYSGEIIILYCDHVTMHLSKDVGSSLSGNKTGRLYLTSHRIIFTNDSDKDTLKSFASPFFALSKVELEQPVFGANYIKGNVKGQPNGGFDTRVVEFKLTFKHGGAIEFGQSMLKVAAMVSRHTAPSYRDAPPPYAAPTQSYGPAPPPAYAPPTNGYYGWAPPTQAFPQRPPPADVYAYEAPPPYPGIDGMVGFVAAPAAPGAVGFAAPPPPPFAAANGYVTAADAKAAEAARSAANHQQAAAYCDPNQPHYAYLPPPAYSEAPPSYYDANKKHD